MSKYTTPEQLKMLAQRTNAEIEVLSGRLDDLTAIGGEPNVITTVKVNGVAQAVTDKALNVAVPVKVSELTNDSKFQTDTEVAAVVAAAPHLQRKKVSNSAAIDPSAADADKYIYMIPKTGSDSDDLYDEYMVLDGKVEHVGNTKVDLTGYVQKVDGKGLSVNDYTDAEKVKLAGIETATDAEVDAMLTEVFGAAGA